MAAFMKPFEAQIYAAFRIVVGLLFLWHGSGKLFGFPPPPDGIPVPVQYIAGSIEFFGGILVMIGLFTSWAAFLCSGLMAFAYWIAHGTQHWLPYFNKGELAILYCFCFLFIAARGSGKWSLDDLRH